MKIKYFVFVISLLILINLVGAIYIEDNRTIINMDHAIRIQEINSVPEDIAPGESATINLKIKK